MTIRALSFLVPDSIPSIVAGDDLVAVVLDALGREGEALKPGDIVVMAQKIVSKAEGKTVDLANVTPSDKALALAETTGKDARLLEVILSESADILRARRDVCIVEHKLGHVMANGGIDHSNLAAPEAGDDMVLLLPDDPDRSARDLRAGFEAAGGTPIGVVITDSFGRPWRLGTVGAAIGVAGPAALIDRRGERDLFGRILESTEVGFADGIAAAAVLAMGEGAEGAPVVVIRGLAWEDTRQVARDVLRPRDKDMFR